MDWTQEVKEARRRYIGGSDAAAILGISRYKSPLSVWAIKTGQTVSDNIDDVVAVKLGVKLEQAVAEFFMEDTGKKVEPVTKEYCKKAGYKYIQYPNEKDVTILHPKYPFLGANIDRIVIGEDAGFEAKTTNQFKASEWEGEDMPAEYLLQCIHYMAVTGIKTWYIGVLIGNMYFRWKKIDYSEKIINDVINKEVNFWNNFIVPKIMPMQISSKDSTILYTLFPQAAPESIIELDDRAQQICEFRDSALADMKALKGQIDEYTNTLKAMLKTYEVGITKTYKVSWKNQKEHRLDTELLKKEEPGIYERYSPETEKRVLRVSVKK